LKEKVNDKSVIQEEKYMLAFNLTDPHHH